jgi:HEAT repeat protein
MKVYYTRFRFDLARSLALLTAGLMCFSVVFLGLASTRPFQDQTARSLNPRQREIAKQQERLNSAEVEERRDAIMKLSAMHHPEASRVSLPALKDSSPIVRAAAAKAILSLPPSEVVLALTPLVTDKDEFVRQETAYALGKTHYKAAVPALGEVLLNDKRDGVRAAAAVALGDIADDSAVPVLIHVLSGQPPTSSKTKRKAKRERNEFVLRAVATALGQIRNRAAVPALVAVLEEEKAPSDVKREAARSLGLIADPAAVPALQTAQSSSDPHLSRVASLALQRIARQ